VAHPALEVADIFRIHGPAWRLGQRGHLSLGQLKVMSAIEQCRSAALGGHVLRCEGCGAGQIAYNSCRNRHCPKCQSSAARRWLDARQADLLPVEYYRFRRICGRARNQDETAVLRGRRFTPSPSPTWFSLTGAEAVRDRTRTGACESDEPAPLPQARSTRCGTI